MIASGFIASDATDHLPVVVVASLVMSLAYGVGLVKFRKFWKEHVSFLVDSAILRPKKHFGG